MTTQDIKFLASDVVAFLRGGFHPLTCALVALFAFLCLGVLNSPVEVEARFTGEVLSVRSASNTIETSAGGFVSGTVVASMGGKKVNLGFNGIRPKVGDKIKILRHKNRFTGKTLSYGGVIKNET